MFIMNIDTEFIENIKKLQTWTTDPKIQQILLGTEEYRKQMSEFFTAYQRFAKQAQTIADALKEVDDRFNNQ